MKKLKLILCLICLTPSILFGQQNNELSIMFWNLENFYDSVNQGVNESDQEFSSNGARRWTRKRMLTKCRAIAKTIYYVAETKGRMPDIFAMAEVENQKVVSSLVFETMLKRSGYNIVHYDSPDPRGIDVALIYRRETLKLHSSKPCRIEGLLTRDILLTQFYTTTGDSIALFSLHFPSKYGGEESVGKREESVRRLCALSDSLRSAGWQSQIAVGDYNEEPSAPVFVPLEKHFACKAKELARSGYGTIRFNGEWQLIDLCYVSPSLNSKCSMEILRLPFLLTKDTAHPGEKPLRTYSGPRYLAGISDHLPILINISYKEEMR